MASDNIDLQEIQQLITLVEKYGLSELTVAEGDLAVTVRNPREEAPALDWEAEESPRPRKAAARRSATRPEAPPAPSRPTVPLISPMTGVFYSSSSPDAPPFVEIGDIITIGQTIGLIEAMKVFSEVPSDISGRLVEVKAQNGVLVQADEPLMLLEPLDGEQENT